MFIGKSYNKARSKNGIYIDNVSCREVPLSISGTIYKIRDMLACKICKHDCLQLAVKANSAPIGTEELCPTLLLFCKFPRFDWTHPREPPLERSQYKERDEKEIQKKDCKNRNQFRDETYHAAEGVDSNILLRDLLLGAPILLFRETKGLSEDRSSDNLIRRSLVSTASRYHSVFDWPHHPLLLEIIKMI